MSEIPLRASSGAVFAATITKSQLNPLVMNVFWPSMT